MRTLPAMMLHLLNPFMPMFSSRVWSHVQVLLAEERSSPRAGERLVPHYVSWVLGKPSSSNATTAFSTVLFGQGER
jgi:hypothetical protein